MSRRRISLVEHPEWGQGGSVPSRVGDLATLDCLVGDLVPGGEVISAFRLQPTLAGAVVHDGEAALGILTRGRLFGALGQRFGMEVFLRRPVGATDLLEPSPLTLQASTPVEEAMRAVLGRAPADLHEPLLIAVPGELGRVLDVRVLMLAQDRLLALAREEAQRQREAAEAAAAAKGRFLANMSHEMRTPLNGILGVTQLLAGTTLSPDQADLLETLRSSANLLLELISDVLDSAKLEAGAVDLHLQPVALAQLCGEVLRLLAPRAAGKNLRLALELEEAVPGELVTDPLRLRQVLLNLVGNAVKFTPRGSVTLRVGLAAPPGPGQRVRVAVLDTGIGIDPSQQAAVFEPFVQADESSTRHHGGTGLGLSISRALVGLLGGELRVDSALGEGSIFSFELPLVVAPAVPAVPTPAVPAPSPPPARATLAGLELLVAEDNPVNQKIVRRLLERLGAGVTVVGDGDQAVKAVAARRFDAVLMDVQMPNVDGLEALAVIRREEQGGPRHLPVIALTAHALAGDREWLLAAGMDGYLAKPVTLEGLLEEVSRVLGAGQRLMHQIPGAAPAPGSCQDVARAWPAGR